MIKTIRVDMRIKTSSNNVKFPTYLATKKDGKCCTLKFTRECIADASSKGLKIPANEGDVSAFEITVDTNNMNISNVRYETVWVKQIEDVKPIERKNACEDLF